MKLLAFFVALSGPFISSIGVIVTSDFGWVVAGQLVMLAGLVVFLALPPRGSRVDATVKPPPAIAETRIGEGGILYVEDESVEPGTFLVVYGTAEGNGRILMAARSPQEAIAKAHDTLFLRAYQYPDAELMHEITEIHAPPGTFEWR